MQFSLSDQSPTGGIKSFLIFLAFTNKAAVYKDSYTSLRKRKGVSGE